MNTREKSEVCVGLLAMLLSGSLVYSGEPAAAPIPAKVTATSKVISMEDLEKRAAALGVALDGDAILKVIAGKESELKAGAAEQTAAFNRVQEISGKVNTDDAELKQLREQGAGLQADHDKRLVEIPAIIELSRKKQALADELQALRVKRDGMYKLHNELKKRKTETGDTSKDDEVAKLVRDLQDTDKRMMQDLPAEMKTVALELAKQKREAGKADPDCARLRAAMDQNSMDIKRKMDSAPGLVDAASAVRTWSERTNVLRFELAKLKTLLKELEAEKKKDKSG